MSAYPRRPSYSIFVRFRRSRLALRRGIARVEDALAIAEELRVGRFHDQGDVFVVKVPEGTIVELPPLAALAEDEAAPPVELPRSVADLPWGALDAALLGPGDAAPPSPIPPAGAAGDPGLAPVSRGRLQSWHPEGAALRRGGAWSELASILKLLDQVSRFQRVMEHAQRVRVRLDLACSAAERALLSHPGTLPAALSRTRERLAALRESSARSVDSFERAGAVVARRLQVARADVGGDP